MSSTSFAFSERKLFTCSFILIFVSFGAMAQTIDNLSSFRMMDSKRYIRINVDNDYFTATDDYYTAGINIEYVSPFVKKNPFNKLLISSRYAKRQYGISVEQNGYTPKSIEHDDILYGDRPFSATLMLKVFSMNIDSMRRQRIVSALSLGVIGQAAGGFGTQRTIHEWINAKTPHGWNNQIRNDVIINYELGFEKNISHYKNLLVLNGISTLRAGTLNTKLSSGFVFMLGKLNPGLTRAFSGTKGVESLPTKKLRFHIYAQPLLNMIAYDATLEGGLFNKSSPYVIPPTDITRITFQANYGFVLSFNSIYLEYFKTIMSKEFESGDFHRWGGIRIGVKL